MHYLRITVLAFLLGLAGTGRCADDTLSSQATAAREAVGAVRSTLNVELYAAMQSGGPLAAMDVCNLRSPRIIEQVSKRKNMTIRRIGTRVRNPANTPDDWEQKTLARFAQRLEQGESPANLESYEMVGKEFRYLRGFVMPEGAACLMCHGQNIDPVVAARIRELYPADKATGYQAGELSGGFSIRFTR